MPCLHHRYSLYSDMRIRALTATLFDCHIRNISNLNYSIYWTLTFSAALEIPADLLAIWGIDKLGRRWSSFLSHVCAGAAMILCGIFLGSKFALLSYS